MERGRSYASSLAIFDNQRGSVVPLESSWIPRIDDNVVGVVKDSRNHVYEVDLHHYTRALIIEGRYDNNSFSIGNVVEAKIKDVEDRKTIILMYPRVLLGGVVVSVRSTKIPRIIGKENTMVRQISDLTRTRISVGHNGLIWIKGERVDLAMRAISTIESEAHMPGLTDRIRVMLEKEIGKKV